MLHNTAMSQRCKGQNVTFVPRIAVFAVLVSVDAHAIRQHDDVTQLPREFTRVLLWNREPSANQMVKDMSRHRIGTDPSVF